MPECVNIIKVLKSNSINGNDDDLEESIDYLNSVAPDGPKTAKIIQTFRAIETFQFNKVLKVSKFSKIFHKVFKIFDFCAKFGPLNNLCVRQASYHFKA